jgi:alpha-D-ribose 1-methylphosphonate 5-phosphate C-P lyase
MWHDKITCSAEVKNELSYNFATLFPCTARCLVSAWIDFVETSGYHEVFAARDVFLPLSWFKGVLAYTPELK